MMFLPALAVVFAGVLGGKGDVDRQLDPVLRNLEVKRVKVPTAALRNLTHYSQATRDVVRSLHADGVIACEVVQGNNLRIVVYEGDGTLKTFSDVAIGARGLSRDALVTVRENLADEIASMQDVEPSRPAPQQAIVVDDEQPSNVPAGRAAESPASRDTEVAAADDAVADDAVSADEIAALTAGTDAPVSTSPARTLHLGVAGGLGIATRTFRPGPSTILPYSASAVPAIVLDGYLQPMRPLELRVSVERSVQLATPMRDGSSAPTTISRWEAAGTYTVARAGSVALGLRAGAGKRAFAIDSADPGRSPDSDYNYVIAGLAATAGLGEHITLRAAAAFEPVLSGTEPTEMAFGEASRWAVDIGAAVELRAWTHVFVRVAASYQRFSWSWNMAGDRGAGGAVDSYPLGTLALGADY